MKKVPNIYIFSGSWKSSKKPVLDRFRNKLNVDQTLCSTRNRIIFFLDYKHVKFNNVIDD